MGIHELESEVLNGSTVGKPSQEKRSQLVWISLMGIAAITLTASAVVLGRRMPPALHQALARRMPPALHQALARVHVYSYVSSSTVPLRAATSVPSRAPSPQPPVLACYYNTPAAGAGQLLPGALHPRLCTHINVAFARVERSQITLDDHQYTALAQVVQLKRVNPMLKVLLSVGGANADSGFSDMVANHASRKIFIKSIKSILRNYTLDGIDLDWEFPGFNYVDLKFGKRDRQHFSQLLREIRAEYIREKRNYLLTVAMAAPQTIIDYAYDVDQLNLYVDFVNLMTYDFHSFTKYTPFTGLNSPLYARPSEQLYFASLNINYTVHYIMSKGLDRDKIVVGIPTYGHTFTLFNADNPGIGSPASSYGALGNLGFVNYPDICTFIEDFRNDVTIVQDEAAQVPYLYRGQEWVSYDSPHSVINKAKFIKDEGLRGAMIYSLNADDYEGICKGQLGGSKKFPLSQSIKNTLINEDSFQDGDGATTRSSIPAPAAF